MQTVCTSDEQRRDIERIASHPCDRLVIIGGSDSEHDSTFTPRRGSRKLLRMKIAWRSRQSGENHRFSCLELMTILAPAISPPRGIGDTKPANKAVLDWVEETARLTEPENIFWCDGSEEGK